MKRVIYIILTMFIFCSFNVVKAEQIDLAESAVSAILIEPSTGEVIFEKNSHEKLHPASMTKMMSMLLIIENIEKGVISWDEMVTTSPNASGMGGSQILLETGEQRSVRDLFKGIAIASGNDAVVAMAEKIAGTEGMFVSMMNERAKQLGLTDTNFKNPHGLDAADHYSSAYDMSIIAKELVKHPQVLEYTSIYEDYLRQNTDRKIWLVNTNKLVRFYPGVDGLKTGYTKEAGYCLTATAKKGNSRFIVVVMGEADSKTRNAEVSEMLDYAFAQYEVEEILSKDTIVGKVPVTLGNKTEVEIIPLESLSFLNKKGTEKRNISYELKFNSLKSSLKTGDKVGEMEVKENDTVIKTIPVTVKENIDKVNIFELYLRNIKTILNGIF